MSDENEKPRSVIAGILERLAAEGVTDTNAPPADPAHFTNGEDSCDRAWHFRPSKYGGVEATRRCPTVVQAEIRATVDVELHSERLAGAIERIFGGGLPTFEGFDTTLAEKGGVDALAAMSVFASGRPPVRGVFIAGHTGLGKTRLLLASHFALLAGGIRSVYVTSPELRVACERSRSFDDEVSTEAERFVQRIIRAQVVHFDDVGDVDNDERRRGAFAQALKSVLDRSRGVWASATNLTWDAAIAHPDVGAKITSRLMDGCHVVNLVGEDVRLSKAAAQP